ncbi:MAG: hypothetical protein HY043_02220, partial [Verrucomicrobia bacterium]|nr:hypothetical protein [Verrucomicrobiota bacterium]
MKRIKVKTTCGSQAANNATAEHGSTNSTSLMLGALLVAGCLGYWLLRSKPPEVSSTNASEQPVTALNNDEPVQPAATNVSVPPTPVPATLAPVSLANVAPVPEKPGSTVAAQQLIAKITQLDLSAGALTTAQTKDLSQSLKQIVAQGRAAVPAIKEFLERNQDLNFSEISGGNQLEAGSLRQGLIEALEKIGGPEAVAVAAKTLETAGDPFEVALLARNLEKNAPEQYR